MRPVVVIRPDAIVEGISFQNYRGRLTAMKKDSRGRWHPVLWCAWPYTCWVSTVYLVKDDPIEL